MDDYTISHLRKWIDSTVARYADDVDGILAGMLSYIQSTDDAEYTVGLGWPTVYERAEEAGYLQS